eukprot:1526558-Prymnesium_polylepis.1
MSCSDQSAASGKDSPPHLLGGRCLLFPPHPGPRAPRECLGMARARLVARHEELARPRLDALLELVDLGR